MDSQGRLFQVTDTLFAEVFADGSIRWIEEIRATVDRKKPGPRNDMRWLDIWQAQDRRWNGADLARVNVPERVAAARL